MLMYQVCVEGAGSHGCHLAIWLRGIQLPAVAVVTTQYYCQRGRNHYTHPEILYLLGHFVPAVQIW